MDRNGYNPSLFSTDYEECFICGAHRETARHEVMYGRGIRPLAKRDGLWINVCPTCHARIHADPIGHEYLRVAAQRLYEARHGLDSWMRRYERNYLEEREWR